MGRYDEGLLFTDAYLLSRGETIYRDFYVNYPPGIMQLIRAVIALPVPTIWSCRLLGFLIRLASGIAAGWFAGLARKRGICLYTVAATLVMQEGLHLVLFAYPVAVLLALCTVISWPRGRAPRWRRFMSGALMASVSYFRHDMLVYAMMPIVAIECGSWLARRKSFFTDSLRELAEVAGALAATLALFWVPVFATSGVSAMLHDLVLDQARLIQPYRVLPIPNLLEPMELGRLQMRVPGIFASSLRLGIVLAIGASVLAALLLVRNAVRESTAISHSTRLLALGTAFLFATLPQAFQRTDYWHVAYGVPIVLAMLAYIGGQRVAAPVLVLALLPWFANTPYFIRSGELHGIWKDRSDERFMTPERRELVAFLQKATAPDEPIFVGCESHVRMIANSVDLYYFAKRPGATRWMQFDPGTVTSASGQRKMIAELKRNDTRVLLREGICYVPEPNASVNEGSSLLDTYLAANYRPIGHIGGFSLWKRNDVP
jgi:hypothetical protein